MREMEPAGQNMSFSTATSKDSTIAEERRSAPRETMKRHVVLVFFGEDNWGKLTNMSESGMAIEFAKPPSLRERVTFTFQAMGCMPMPRHGKALGDSFEAPGEIVWTREFERGAGVQFVDMAEASREQIREWLSFEASSNTSTPRAERVKPEVQPILAELLSPFGAGFNAESVADKDERSVELDMPVPLAETISEPDSAFLESSVAEQSYQAPSWRAQEETVKGSHVPELPATSHPSVARLTFLVVSGCLAAFAVTAGVRIFMSREAHRADAAVQTSDPGPTTGESAAEVNAPSPVPTPVSSPAAPVVSSSAVSGAAAAPFQVDVLDTSGRNWILWFVRGGAKDAKDKDSQPSYTYRPTESSNSSASTTRPAKRQETPPPEKQQAAHTFTMVAPTVSHPLESSSPGKASAEAPALQSAPSVSSGDPFGGVLGRQMAPAAPVVHAPTGGMVQQPRLIRATLPAYPQLAKSSRVSGDVVVDALIDAAGKVSTVKVISGPALLQQAAMDTVRQWKYEPARLDGQAVPMHLSVTVKFRLN